MENFSSLLGAVYLFLNRPMTVWGISFSLWSVCITTLLLGVIFWFVMELFSDF